MPDVSYSNLDYRLPELPHRYGDKVHLVGNPLLLSLLAVLGAKGTIQPQINRLVTVLYEDLVKMVLNRELPRKRVTVPTRMIDSTPKGIYQGEVIERQVNAVSVNIARAGTLPSMVTYDLLNLTLEPGLVRQDHIIMSRMLDEHDSVVGSNIGGAKIGGTVDDAFLFFPDPMGATGSSLTRAISHYKTRVEGTPRRIICIHLIVTPEYLKRITTDHPDVEIYALRLDRGLSDPDVLETIPGTHWERERGLDDRQYIVPGAGGLGEVMNNAYA